MPVIIAYQSMPSIASQSLLPLVSITTANLATVLVVRMSYRKPGHQDILCPSRYRWNGATRRLMQPCATYEYHCTPSGDDSILDFRESGLLEQPVCLRNMGLG
jgi:hypothetical protein